MLHKSLSPCHQQPASRTHIKIARRWANQDNEKSYTCPTQSMLANLPNLQAPPHHPTIPFATHPHCTNLPLQLNTNPHHTNSNSHCTTPQPHNHPHHTAQHHYLPTHSSSTPGQATKTPTPNQTSQQTHTPNSLPQQTEQQPPTSIHANQTQQAPPPKPIHTPNHPIATPTSHTHPIHHTNPQQKPTPTTPQQTYSNNHIRYAVAV